MWRSGQALRPYFEDAKVIVKNKAMFKSLADHSNVVDLEALDFVHFPIKDCSITDDAAVLRLAQSLVARLHRGERLYVHCWGGHGRTGTVICIMLHLMYGVSTICTVSGYV
jgi:protein-tyrosine phosphatase